MPITTRKPPIKETIGAQYVCFNKMSDEDEWTEVFEENVEKTEVVKKVSLTENAENPEVWASGKIYDSDTSIQSIDIETEVIAFPEDTLEKMRGDHVGKILTLSGGNGVRPYFAYGKVVKLKGGKVRFEWFPKCKLVENTDEAATKESSFSEQTDTIKIKAYPFNENEDIKVKIDSTSSKFPEELTEEKFFSKPILKDADLETVLGKA